MINNFLELVQILIKKEKIKNHFISSIVIMYLQVLY